MPALLTRFPSWRFRGTSAPVLPADLAARHPELAGDVRVLGEVLAPRFAERDLAALRLQHAHRRRSVVVLVGSALLTGLGGLQAAYPGQAWPGLVLGVLAAVVAGAGRVGGERRTGGRYLAARLQAERLRALHFRYLARTAPFDTGDDGPRRQRLERAVVEVEQGREPS